MELLQIGVQFTKPLIRHGNSTTRFSSCELQFWGSNMGLMCIASPRVGLNEEEIQRQPNIGNIFSLKANLRG